MTSRLDREHEPYDHRGGEPLNIDTIGDALVVKEGDVFLFSDEHGEVRPEARAGFGLYHDDTRYLSQYHILLQGQEPVVLLSTAETGYSSEQVMTNRRLAGKRGRIALSETLQVRRVRVVQGGVAEHLEIVNYGATTVAVDLILNFAADFADIFEVRGLDAPPRGVLHEPQVRPNAVKFGYECLDGRLLSTEIRFSREPTELSRSEARFEFDLEPQVVHNVDIAITIDKRDPPQLTRSLGRLHQAYTDWRRRPTRVLVDDRFFQEAIDRALDDIRMLLRPFDEHDPIIAAGVPWFDAPFGRDSVIASLQMLPYRPEIARATLRLLADHQGRDVIPDREEQPGKIIHEMRGGELARTGRIPFGHYYGSVDSTPLFLVLYAEYLSWTNDHELEAELAPNVEAALRWIEEFGDLDGDGYIEYAPSQAGGLVNQGWKDSHDGIIDEHGERLRAPIALVEAQGYVYAALMGLSRVARNRGAFAEAEALTDRATRLRKNFQRDFYLPDERFLALALDGDKRPSRAVASNAGHALWAGILEQAPADVVARRLFSDEMFSGWGIRTLSSAAARYNPMGYHLGTVWPHDNSLAGMGLKRYGYDEHLIELTGALFDVAHASPYYRLPELFCGHPRLPQSPPVPYPVACRPQAWAAGSLPYLLQALLGLYPDAAHHRLLLVRPTLPPWLNSVLLEDLHVGDGTAHLLVQRQYDRAEVRVIGARGLTVEVVADWPAGL